MRVVPTKFPSNVLHQGVGIWPSKLREVLLGQGWGVQVLNGMPLVPFLTVNSYYKEFMAGLGGIYSLCMPGTSSSITAKEKLS